MEEEEKGKGNSVASVDSVVSVSAALGNLSIEFESNDSVHSVHSAFMYLLNFYSYIYNIKMKGATNNGFPINDLLLAQKIAEITNKMLSNNVGQIHKENICRFYNIFLIAVQKLTIDNYTEHNNLKQFRNKKHKYLQCIEIMNKYCSK